MECAWLALTIQIERDARRLAPLIWVVMSQKNKTKMTDEDKLILDKKIKQYDVALATRNFEIELFWKRSLFFWGFIASAFVGYATLFEKGSRLAVVLACFGFICSYAWTLVNRGSKRWQENWELLVGEFENDVTGELFKSRREKQKKNLWLSARKFSVSKLTIALSDFTVIIWTSLLIYHLIKIITKWQVLSIDSILVLAIFGSFTYAIIMHCNGVSSD